MDTASTLVVALVEGSAIGLYDLSWLEEVATEADLGSATKLCGMPWLEELATEPDLASMVIITGERGKGHTTVFAVVVYSAVGLCDLPWLEEVATKPNLGSVVTVSTVVVTGRREGHTSKDA